MGCPVRESAVRVARPHAVGVADGDGGADEERWITIGMDSLNRILVVVYTWRDERVRLISARPAGRDEAHQYEARNRISAQAGGVQF